MENHAQNIAGASGLSTSRPKTFCNPLDLPYCFREEEPSRREAADPTMIVHNGRYWLFASKSEGYWYSDDLVHWELVKPQGLPLTAYAPTVEIIGGRFIWAAVDTGMYVADDPLTGEWRQFSRTCAGGDPALFQDDDGSVYLYFGCAPNGPIFGRQLDPQTLEPLGEPIPLFEGCSGAHGWEVPGEPDAEPADWNKRPYTEGAWMTKRDGVYYLQYAAPGTEWKSYGDGVYVGRGPLGPFEYAPYSPFSCKPGGFIGGAGHGSTFRDVHGEYWHIATMSISVRHMFERRVGLFPTWFEAEQMVTDTYFGDYPQYLPGELSAPSKGAWPGWMLLTYAKPADVSSSLNDHPAELALNEDIRTWWSAQTGAAGEWMEVDMGSACTVHAAQINFADEGSVRLHRLDDGYGYKLLLSEDRTKWTLAVDRSDQRLDSPHDYVELVEPLVARYARLVNVHSPAGALFSISGLRLFGLAPGPRPAPVAKIDASRDPSDSRRARIAWSPSAGADGYVVRYGIRPDRLYSNYQVLGATSVAFHSLNAGVPYYFAVDSFSASGIGRGTEVMVL